MSRPRIHVGTLLATILAATVGCTTLPAGATVRISMHGEEPPPHEVMAVIDTTVGTGGIQLTSPVERARAMAESAARAAGADLAILVEEEDVVEKVELREPSFVRLPARRYRWNLARTAPPRSDQ